MSQNPPVPQLCGQHLLAPSALPALQSFGYTILLNLTRWHRSKNTQRARPYHEPRCLLDVFGGDSQEQDRNKSKRQQRDGDDRVSGALSHEVKVRSAALLCARWKSERRLNSGQVGEVADGFPLAGRYHSPPEAHASPAACLLFYISLELAEPDLNLCSERSQDLLHVSETFSSVSEWDQLQGYWGHGGKNVFYDGLVEKKKLLLIHIQRLFWLELHYKLCLIMPWFI